MKAKKIVPKEFTRSLEVIIRENPYLTGKEILAEEKHDEACFALYNANRNKAKLDFIKDINTNGGYYKGRFGSDQRFYYNISNARLEKNRIYADVETIVVFLGDGRSVVSPGDIKIEKRKKEFKDLDTYDLDMYYRTTKKDYDEVSAYLAGLAKYWEDIKKI